MAGAHLAARPVRKWPRRLLIGLNIFLAFCVLLTGTTYLYVRWRYGQIDKLDFGALLQNRGEDEPGTPMNVLLVGSDTRANLTVSEQAEFGTRSEVAGQRSDTIMILHADPATKQAAILSIPRDLWVTMPDTGRRQRINIAFEGKDGPRRLIRTIQANLGIQIDHYAQVDFKGFQGIVKAVGGVKVYFPAPARDRLAGLRIPRAGCIELSGDQALAYVRSRHYQTYESGRWRTDPTSDFGRIQRQQDFIRRMIRAAIRSGVTNPVKLNQIVQRGVSNLTIDNKMSTKDLAKLGLRFRSLAPEAVEMITLPTEPAKVGGADVLRLKQPEARQIVDRFNGIKPEAQDLPPAGVLPAQVRVRVLNGSGISGHAGSVAVLLQRQGFGVSGTGDADRFTYDKPEIRYAPGQRIKAQLLRAYLQGGAELVTDQTLRGGDIVLVTGSGLQGVRAPGAAGSPTTSTPPVSAPPKGAAPLQPTC